MCFDFIVFALNTYKLVGSQWYSESLERMTQSRLSKMIFADGLIYFFIAYVVVFTSFHYYADRLDWIGF